MVSIKDRFIGLFFKDPTIHYLPKNSPVQQRQIQIKSEKTETDILSKQNLKANRNSFIDKIRRDKEGHYIMIK